MTEVVPITSSRLLAICAAITGTVVCHTALGLCIYRLCPMEVQANLLLWRYTSTQLCTACATLLVAALTMNLQ